MNKYKLLPNIKVNYTTKDIISAIFIKARRNKYVFLLSKGLCNFFGVEDIILTSSGRSALYHLLSYLPQSSVIVPAYTCDVVIEAVMLAGKNIVYAHADRDTLNINGIPEIDSNSIVIATHQYGFPCMIREICAVCKQKGAIVIEDCAGAFGAEIGGQMTGTFGDYAIFSFNASKLINAPSSGGFLIAKNDKDLIALRESIKFKPCCLKYKVKSLCKSLAFCFDKNPYIHYWLSRVIRHDASKAYLSSESYNPNPKVLEDYHYGFYNWQAYVVLKQLKSLPLLLKNRAELAIVYKTRLNQVYQREEFYRQNCCIRYPVYLNNREEIRKRSRELGVEVGAGFEHFVCPNDYQEELTIGKEIAYLPYSSNYSTKEINSIVTVLNQVADEQSISS